MYLTTMLDVEIRLSIQYEKEEVWTVNLDRSNLSDIKLLRERVDRLVPSNKTEDLFTTGIQSNPSDKAIVLRQTYDIWESTNK